MTRYRLSPRAATDLSDIWDYSASQWGVAQADRYVLSIRSTCEALADGRLKGQSAEHARRGYHKQVVGSHLLFFRVQPDGTFDIVRILHQRMDTGAHLQNQ